MNELALFAGAGGGVLGSQLLGWRTVCAVEIEPYARDVLMARQNDGCLDPFPIWDDVRTFDGRAWEGCVDVVTAGWPCTDISVAGRGAGIEGEQSGLWSEVARILADVSPRACLLENSPALTSRGLGRVLGDLASMGFDAEWGVIGAHHAGAPHRRDRIWLVAAHAERLELRDEPGRRHGEDGQGAPELADDGTPEHLAHTSRRRRERRGSESAHEDTRTSDKALDWWSAEPDVGRVAHGVAARVDRLRCIGNGQVPSVAALAWRTLLDRMGES